MSKKTQKQEIVIYKGRNGKVELRADIDKDTVWASLDQIANLFGRDKSVISRHIRDVFKTGELDREPTVAKNATVQIEGDRRVTRNIEYYNLDVILSVGYRVNSKQATLFRKWATDTLKSYIVYGFVVNKQQISKNYEKFLSVVDNIKKLLPNSSSVNPKDAIELISLFADTWLSLDAYDKGQLPKGKLTKKKVDITSQKISEGLAEFRKSLIQKDEASDIFGNERQADSLSGIVGNVMQSFDGKELYATVEEKAAHLLYFIVKNHPFIDGNKRSGAFAFVWFLKQVNILDASKLTPSALTALTILVAESDPNHKDRIVKLITSLISG